MTLIQEQTIEALREEKWQLSETMTLLCKAITFQQGEYYCIFWPNGVMGLYLTKKDLVFPASN